MEITAAEITDISDVKKSVGSLVYARFFF